jgi:hypothetical protein
MVGGTGLTELGGGVEVFGGSTVARSLGSGDGSGRAADFVGSGG